MKFPILKSPRFSLANSRVPWHLLWNQPISMVIRMPWLVFFLTTVLIFLAEVVLFWLLYRLDSAGIIGTVSMALQPTIVYSLQTLFSSSFANLNPATPYALSVSILECLTGIITTSLVTSLILARLLQTESPLIFSRHLCMSSWDEGYLYCRFVTFDPSSWLNVAYTLSLLMDMQVEPGVWQRRVIPLKLVNPQTPQLSLTATMVHPIDVDSPLRSLTQEQLVEAKALFIYLVEGTDEVTGTQLLQVRNYSCADLRIHYRFADLVGVNHKGERHVFMERLDQLVPLKSEL